jgi:hypothetical protein
MSLIEESDVQVHLPVDKLQLEEVPDSLTEVWLDVERVIKGRLSGVYTPTTLAAWSTPDTTPEYVRAIGGRLAAALIYRLRLAQDYPDDAEYALLKYNEAMSMLDLLAGGDIILPETELPDTGAHLSTGHYVVGVDPKFTMDDEYA